MQFTVKNDNMLSVGKYILKTVKYKICANKKHENYKIYKSIIEDLRYGLLKIEDKIQRHKNNEVSFDYER